MADGLEVKELSYNQTIGDLKYMVNGVIYLAHGVSPYQRNEFAKMLRQKSRGGNSFTNSGRAVNYMKKFNPERLSMDRYQLASELLVTAKSLLAQRALYYTNDFDVEGLVKISYYLLPADLTGAAASSVNKIMDVYHLMLGEVKKSLSLGGRIPELLPGKVIKELQLSNRNGKLVFEVSLLFRVNRQAVVSDDYSKVWRDIFFKHFSNSNGGF